MVHLGMHCATDLLHARPALPEKRQQGPPEPRPASRR